MWSFTPLNPICREGETLVKSVLLEITDSGLVFLGGYDSKEDELSLSLKDYPEPDPSQLIRHADELFSWISCPEQLVEKKWKPCIHGRRHDRCRDCGVGYCIHDREKYQCRQCGRGYCLHGKKKFKCKICPRFCTHRKRVHLCRICTPHSKKYNTRSNRDNQNRPRTD